MLNDSAFRIDLINLCSAFRPMITTLRLKTETE